MAPNSLSPSSVLIDYHSLYGAHKMTIPTLQWLPTNLTGTLGSYLAWDGVTSVDAEAMVNALVDLLKVFVISSTAFDLATVYNQATATSDNIPARSVALTQVGTSSATGFTQAQSATFNFKTTANGDAKLILLDSPIGSAGFVALHPASFSAAVLALEVGFTDTASAWSGRDDARPNVLRKVTYDLNEKLQRAYKMGA
jgi:hypothetical protein